MIVKGEALQKFNEGKLTQCDRKGRTQMATLLTPCPFSPVLFFLFFFHYCVRGKRLYRDPFFV